MADKLCINEIAGQLISIGFECMRCGECCSARFGDNTVMLFPYEIEKILEEFSMTGDEICTPSLPLFRDSKGVFHTFGRVLNRHSNGDCIFIADIKTCLIYQQRPCICSTYPFFLGFTNRSEKPDLIVSECKGIGQPINKDDAIKLAEMLKRRLRADITEEMRILENLEGCEDWEPVRDYSVRGLPVAVHDSSGIKYITGCHLYGNIL